jgi:two-component system response regulator AtoC
MAHVLLIDDDPALIPGQVRQAFPAPGHRVEVAATGADGLDRVRALPPDVILLDLRLPTSPAWRSTSRSAASTRASR